MRQQSKFFQLYLAYQQQNHYMITFCSDKRERVTEKGEERRFFFSEI